MRRLNLWTIMAIFELALFALGSGCSSGPSKGSEVGNPAEDDIATPLLKNARLTDRIELRYSDRFAFAGSNGSYELTETSDGSPAVAIAVTPTDAATLLTIRSCPVAARFTGWQGFESCRIDNHLFATEGTNLVILEFHKTVDLLNELRLVLDGAGPGSASGGQPSGTSSKAQKTGLDDWDWTSFVVGAAENFGEADGEETSEGPEMQIITPNPAEDALPSDIMIVPGSGGGVLPGNTADKKIDVDIIKVLKPKPQIDVGGILHPTVP